VQQGRSDFARGADLATSAQRKPHARASAASSSSLRRGSSPRAFEPFRPGHFLHEPDASPAASSRRADRRQLRRRRRGSLGIKVGIGREPDIAINHDREAIAMHAANHPGTKHYCEDVWKVDPRVACGGRRPALAWFSPDCKHFSKAKGGKPVDKNIRGLAWLVILWAKTVRPRVIMLENVEEFEDWGPLGEDNRPDPARIGLTFRIWKGKLEALGYKVEHRDRRSDYGAPTTRKRLFLIARCDGLPIVWPEKSDELALTDYRVAADLIEWELPTYSIFLTREEGKQLRREAPARREHDAPRRAASRSSW
jgi:site-specific DNA-cytosine methylase